ncbi:MAG: hypothetical protein K2Y26_02725 [Gemmatimonadaceae bacterium]|nr:hypothetical protein [Gemmatimonadaceae bacterium]
MRFSSRRLLAPLGLLLLAGLSSQRLTAQGTSATYVYLRGGDTLGTEALTAQGTQSVGRLALRNQPLIEWTHQRQTNNRLGPLRIRVLQTPTSATPIQDVTFAIAGDSLRVAITTGKTVSQQAVQVPMPDVVPLVNASVLHTAFVADYGKRRELDRIPIVLTTGAQTALAQLAQQGGRSVLTLGKTVYTITWAKDGLPETVDIPNQNSRIVRVR